MLVPTLQTERLMLRPYDPADIAALARQIGAREVAANLLRVPFPYTEQDARVFIASTKESGDANFAIMLREQDSLIGGIGLRIHPSYPRAELGYWLGHEYWGKGYATEAAQSVVEYGFHILGLHRVHASTFKENSVSAKVLRKIGMRHEGSLRQHVLKWGCLIDLEIYGILRSEWKQPQSKESEAK